MKNYSRNKTGNSFGLIIPEAKLKYGDEEK
jgi:hypothetical protein